MKTVKEEWVLPVLCNSEKALRRKTGKNQLQIAPSRDAPNHLIVPKKTTFKVFVTEIP